MFTPYCLVDEVGILGDRHVRKDGNTLEGICDPPYRRGFKLPFNSTNNTDCVPIPLSTRSNLCPRTRITVGSKSY